MMIWGSQLHSAKLSPTSVLSEPNEEKKGKLGDLDLLFYLLLLQRTVDQGLPWQSSGAQIHQGTQDPICGTVWL